MGIMRLWELTPYIAFYSGGKRGRDTPEKGEQITMKFGRCYEEFEIGAVYKHWPGRTITEYDDTLFCMLTMNHHPLHIDANYAETTQFKQRLVVGSLVFSIVLGMTVEDVSGKAIANLEFEHVKHLAPTFHGDTIYAETTVLEKRLTSSNPERGVVTVETIAYNQRGENVLSFKRSVVVPTRALDEAERQAWEAKMQRASKGMRQVLQTAEISCP